MANWSKKKIDADVAALSNAELLRGALGAAEANARGDRVYSDLSYIAKAYERELNRRLARWIEGEIPLKMDGEKPISSIDGAGYTAVAARPRTRR